MSVTYFRNLLKVNLSVPGSNAGNFAREGEEATVLWWEEFLDKLDSSDSEGLLPQLLVFITSYRKGHSTETALLKIVNDILLNMNKQHVTLLVLLDLSAAFDTVVLFTVPVAILN